jgi:adenylate kinase family enzyme
MRGNENSYFLHLTARLHHLPAVTGGSIVFPRRAVRATARCVQTWILWAVLVPLIYAAGPVILLIGPPGAGRTTQAEILKKDLGMAIIDADDLIAANKEKFQKSMNPSMEGVDPYLDPILNTLVDEALGRADLSKGLVLDGYPASKVQADFLSDLRDKYNLPKALVIHLRVPDDVARKRLANQKIPNLDQQFKDYHREFDFARVYFPQADIQEVDGTKKPAEVSKEIRKLLKK